MLKFGLLNSIQQSSNLSGGGGVGGGFTPARVIDVFLTPESIKEYYDGDLYLSIKEEVTIGSIIFADLKAPIGSNDRGGTNVAKPLFANIKNFPLKKEVVLILATTTHGLVDTNQQTASTNEFTYYYISPINIWGNLNHNALPEEIFFPETPPSLNKTYSDSENGDPNQVNNEFHDIELGLYFKEKENVQSLQPFEGDIIYEGRFGNSLRFSSTVLGSENPWSEFPENGDPITILRNGFYDNGKEPWDTITEDINKDKSSIYLTSTQKINIDVSSKEYNSYAAGTEPTAPKDYTKEQIIITSNRILINSKDDHVLLSGAKSIGLSSKSSVNIDAKNTFIVKSPKIILGTNDESQASPLLLGDKTVNLLSSILIDMQTLCTQFSVLASLPPGVPFVPLNTAAIQVNTNLQKYQGQLQSLLSQISKTK
jgi:hypothetical protein